LVFKDGVSELTPSVTIGVATKDAEASGLEALIKRADELLYEGKRAGRDRVVVGREGLSPR
jgi:PleD family two-component response regulator